MLLVGVFLASSICTGVMASSNGIPSIQKLLGRENYTTWVFAVQSYLEHEDLWDCVNGAETDAKKLLKAKAKIVLLVDPINFVHIQNAESAKDMWDKLKTVFQDSGLTRKVGLLRTLITTRLENCDSVEEYVNKIISTAHKLAGIGFAVSDEWIGTFLLAGLSDDYKPMIMGIESSGVKITGDSIKMKLLQDVQVVKQNGEQAFYSGKQRHNKQRAAVKSKQGQRCYECNQHGHIARECSMKRNNSKVATVAVDNKSKPSSSHTGFCAVYSTGQRHCDDWFIDSGASMHMTMRDDWLVNRDVPQIKDIVVANNTRIPVVATGCVNININCNGSVDVVPIRNVQYVPELAVNLLSVSQIVKKGYSVRFEEDGCRIYNGSSLVATAVLDNNMYRLKQGEHFGLSACGSSAELWHRRLAHLNYTDMDKLKSGLVNGVDYLTVKNKSQCVACLKGKQCRQPFKNTGTRAKALLELVHSDLCGPMDNKSFGGAKYFFTLIDDFSRKVFVYFLKLKSEVTDVFVDFQRMVENQCGCRIKILRTDNGLEYMNEGLSAVLRKSGIRHQTSIPYTPEQNGLAERMNRTLCEKARCMIFDAGLERTFWAEAVSTAAFLANRSPNRGLGDINLTPEEIWSGKKPDLSNLKLFGCRAMAHIPKQKRKKWDSKSEECVFVGYLEESKGYRLIQPLTGKLVKSRDVVFIESTDGTEEVPIGDILDESLTDSVGAIGPNSVTTTADDMVSGEEEYFTDDSEYIPECEVPLSTDISVRRSERAPKPKTYDGFVMFSNESIEAGDPFTVEEALNGPDADFWKKAMKEEYDALMENKTWYLTNLPANRKAIDSKWIFKTKRDADGNITRYKARLVVKGCAQRKGIDFEETFSPVVRYSSIRYLIALAAKFNLEIEQMDAVTAFLQGDLDDEVYVLQPKEFRQGTQVCRLNKAIYGLKQASRQWNKKLDATIKEVGLKQSKVDPCIYHRVQSGKMLFLAVYVDDILLFSNDIKMKAIVKSHLQKRFKMKDLGEASSCVGLHITRNREEGKIFIDQSKYINAILAKFNMSDCKPVATPFDSNQKLSSDMSPKTEIEVQEMAKVPYQEAVGSILYLTQGTRPDIAYAVNTVCKYSRNPGKAHWSAVKRIFRYLRGTANAKLVFSKNGGPEITGYCDADWANDLDERRSCTGYVFTLQGGSISWNCKRQPTVALSSTEAEYMALSSAIQEAMWLKQFQHEFWDSSKAITIFCDNKSAIDLASTDSYHARSKHIDIRHHFVREQVNTKQIVINHMDTNYMVADALTKGVFANKQEYCAKLMGLILY